MHIVTYFVAVRWYVGLRPSNRRCHCFCNVVFEFSSFPQLTNRDDTEYTRYAYYQWPVELELAEIAVTFAVRGLQICRHFGRLGKGIASSCASQMNVFSSFSCIFINR